VRILVVDDDRAVRKALQVNLSKQGWQVTLAENVTDALEALHELTFDVVLTDVRMPDGTGIDLLAAVRTTWPETPVVVMTGYSSVADAVAAMKGGAADYLIKPIAKDELLVVLDRTIEQRSLKAELVELRREVQERYGFENLIGTTDAMVEVYETVAAVADTPATVLLTGETGTGKEVLAHAIHYRSPRSGAPFVRVNCAAIPESLIESELFGHERGSFTGAVRQHQGKFEQANGGTILLDEIGEIQPFVQAKLLRVLENGEMSRVGSESSQRVDVRVIAATNKDLAQEVRAERFRSDLYYRLNVVRIPVPPLRSRLDDVPLLVDHFLAKHAARHERPVPVVATAAMRELMGYDWPGNVRQLEHVVERALILSQGQRIEHFELPTEEAEAVQRTGAAPSVMPPPDVKLQDWLLRYERQVIVAALRQAGGVQAKAARRLGVSRSNLNYRIQRLGIVVKDVEYE